MCCAGIRACIWPALEQHQAMQSKQLNLLINAGSALVAVIVVGYVVYSAFNVEAERACSARYPAATRFSLQSGQGRPLTAIELQARAGSRDMGVIDNAAVVNIDRGPAPEALEVKLRRLPGSDDASDEVRNGIEFRWSPPGMRGATSACLSYSLWLPDKFDFGGGGELPGVFGYAPQQGRPASDRLSASPQWNAQGTPFVVAKVEGGDVRRMRGEGASIPTNRWVHIEQEIVLNAPGQNDGLARLWVDGTMVVDDPRVPLRIDANAVLEGVLASIGYRRLPKEPGMLRLSQIEVAWR
jgi:hypothetical protein